MALMSSAAGVTFFIMNTKELALATLLAGVLAWAGSLRAQDAGETPAAPNSAKPAPPPAARVMPPKLPYASPESVIKQRVGLTDIEIDYSRPSANGHQIFGGIVPYGQIWRTGDNASTKIRLGTMVKMNGVEVPPGEYALYTIPDEKQWTVIIYKDAGLWGVYDYGVTNDFARLKVMPQKLTDPVETFTMDLNEVKDDSATLNLSWARVRVPIKIEVDIVPDLLAKIDAAMAAPGKKQASVCLDAATFYYNHSKDANDLVKVLRWVNEGLIGNPSIAYELLYLKAQILAKTGDSTGAAAAAQQSTTLAIQAEGVGTPYVKLNRDVTSRLRP
jgi:Protein of unknown function (DUF2911)